MAPQNNTFSFIFEELHRIKEIQIGIKPLIEEALEQKKIPKENHFYELGLKNYNEYWKLTKSDVFFEVSLLVRLGSIIEHGLRIYFMYKMNFNSTTELYNHFTDSNGKLIKGTIYSEGVFQRWNLQNSSNIVALFYKYINIELEKVKFCNVIKEIVTHRNQFVHKLGMLDEKYITSIRELTGLQINVAEGLKDYPNVDYIDLRATENLEDYINNTISFFEELTIK